MRVQLRTSAASGSRSPIFQIRRFPADNEGRRETESDRPGRIAGKNSDARDQRGVGHALPRLHWPEVHRHYQSAGRRRESAAAASLRALSVRTRLRARCGRFARGQLRRVRRAVRDFLPGPQMIERACDQSLKTAAVEIQIFRRIDAGLLRFAQWFRARGAEGDDQDIRPFVFGSGRADRWLFFARRSSSNRAGLFCWRTASSRSGCVDMTHLGETAKIGACSPNEIRVLGVENAGGGRGSCRGHFFLEADQRKQNVKARPSSQARSRLRFVRRAPERCRARPRVRDPCHNLWS